MMCLTLDNGNSEAAVGRGCINCTFAGRFNECKEKEKENPSNPRLKDDLFIFFFSSECLSVRRVRADGIFMYLKRVRCVCACVRLREKHMERVRQGRGLVFGNHIQWKQIKTLWIHAVQHCLTKKKRNNARRKKKNLI